MIIYPDPTVLHSHCAVDQVADMYPHTPVTFHNEQDGRLVTITASEWMRRYEDETEQDPMQYW